MRRIPEVIDLDRQADQLTFMFQGFTHFENVRGKCGDALLFVTDAEMRNKDGSHKSPDSGATDLKKFFNSVAIVRGKIAQLERDGYTLAANEVRKALMYPDYRMLGEIKPLTKTAPVTLAIFHPEMTLAVLKRVQPEGVPESWKLLYQSSLPQDFPLVKKHIFFYTDVLETLTALNQPMLEKTRFRIARKHASCIDLNRSTVIPYTKKTQWEKNCSNTFAFVFRTKKKNILKCFSHEEQSKIAVWQFDLPKTPSSTLVFGLHLQAEHDYWQRKRAPFCSLNIAHGYGAIAYPGEAYHCFDKKSRKFKGTRILLTN